jgi:hypothetical protein
VAEKSRISRGDTVWMDNAWSMRREVPPALLLVVLSAARPAWDNQRSYRCL